MKPFWDLKMLMVPLWFIYVNSVFLNCLTALEAPVPTGKYILQKQSQ